MAEYTCRGCGKPFCSECIEIIDNEPFCKKCVQAMLGKRMETRTQPMVNQRTEKTIPKKTKTKKISLIIISILLTSAIVGYVVYSEISKKDIFKNKKALYKTDTTEARGINVYNNQVREILFLKDRIKQLERKIKESDKKPTFIDHAKKNFVVKQYGGTETIDKLNVRVVYFVPKGKMIDKDWEKKITWVMSKCKNFHEAEFELHSFFEYNLYPSPLIGEHYTEFYQKKWYYSIGDETSERLGFPSEEKGYPILVVFFEGEQADGGGCLGGLYKDGGLVVISGEVMDSLPVDGIEKEGNFPSSVVYHEIGHALGLPHEERHGLSVMGAKGTYAGLDNTSIDREQLAQMLFILEPREKKKGGKIAEITITCDDYYELFINGTLIGYDHDANWRTFGKYNIVLNKEDIIAVKAKDNNNGEERKCGLFVNINFPYDRFQIGTDETWWYTKQYEPEWSNSLIDKKNWQMSRLVEHEMMDKLEDEIQNMEAGTPIWGEGGTVFFKKELKFR